MRLSEPETIHTLAMVALPVFVAWMGYGVPAATLVTLAMAGAGIVIRLRGLTSPGDPDRIELHTISYSHYVEKVRWCLDRTGLRYTEVANVGILGLVLGARTVPLLVLPASRTSIGDSPQILRFLWGSTAVSLPPDRRRFLEPTAEAVALERRFDNVLGVKVRVWSYWHLLQQRDLTLMMWGLDEPSVPSWQRKLLPLLQPALAALLRRMLGVTEASAAAGLAATKEIFAEVDSMLADGRRYLLGGTEISFVDITFASLAALALFPDGYGGDGVSIHAAPLDRLAPAWRAEVEALRNTPAGLFVMRLYAEERRRA
jgi:glutathione S-transferase